MPRSRRTAIPLDAFGLGIRSADLIKPLDADLGDLQRDP